MMYEGLKLCQSVTHGIRVLNGSSDVLMENLCLASCVRLTGVVGGLLLALGCLFTSFATQFHQLYISYGGRHMASH